MIILKVTKNQGFILSLENTFLEKPQRGSNWPSPVFLGLSIPEFVLNFNSIYQLFSDASDVRVT